MATPETLAERRAAVLTEHAAQEKYDPFWAAEAKAGRPLADRPVAFLCDDEVVVVGGCVPKVMAGVRAFLDRADEYGERAAREPSLRHALGTCRKIADRHADDGPELRLPSQWWNAVTYALGESGVLCCVAQGDGA